MKNPIKLIDPKSNVTSMQNYSTVMPSFNQKNYGHVAGNTVPGISSTNNGGDAIKEFDYERMQPLNTSSGDPLSNVQKQKQDNRNLQKAIKSAKRYNKRNPNNKVAIPVGKGTQSLQNQINKGMPDVSLPPVDLKQTINNMYEENKSPFGMMDQQYDQINPQGTAPMMGAPLQPSNTMGNAQPVFNPNAINAAQQIYGSQDQRTMAMPLNTQLAPLNFVDQTGDGKVTYGDVIKARVEGYKESPAEMSYDESPAEMSYKKSPVEQRQQSVPGAPLYMHEDKPHVQLNTKLEDYKGSDFYTGLESEKEKQVLRDSIVGKINSGNFRSGKNAYLDGKVKALRNMHLVKNGFPQENIPTKPPRNKRN